MEKTMTLEELKMEQFKGMTVEQVIAYASRQAREAIELLNDLEEEENKKDGTVSQGSSRLMAKNR
jgi:hypothetical protein